MNKSSYYGVNSIVSLEQRGRFNSLSRTERLLTFGKLLKLTKYREKRQIILKSGFSFKNFLDVIYNSFIFLFNLIS